MRSMIEELELLSQFDPEAGKLADGRREEDTTWRLDMLSPGYRADGKGPLLDSSGKVVYSLPSL